MIRPTENQPDETMLADAVGKARKLVEELRRQQAELDSQPATPPGAMSQQLVSQEQLARGREAFDSSITAAARMLGALESAAALAPDSHTTNS
jgi:hypothetical protein